MSDAPPQQPEVELGRTRFAPSRQPLTPPPPAAPVEGGPESPSQPPRRPEVDAPATSGTGSSPAPSPGRGAVAQDLTDAAYGALVIVFGAAWLTHRWLGRRPGWQLREPTTHDYQAVSAPLGRIAARHLPVDVAPRVALSVKDGAEAVGAARRYMARGPLLEHVDVDLDVAQPPEEEQTS